MFSSSHSRTLGGNVVRISQLFHPDSRFSKIKFATGEPPSSKGLSHSIDAVFAVT